MSVLALGSVRSCGVTTLALALAATWPSARRVLLVEADPAGGTLAAAANWPPEPGLVSLAAATRRADDLTLVCEHCRVLAGGPSVLTAPASGEQARHALAMLGGMLAGLRGLDADVLLDCGRLELAASTVARAPASTGSWPPSVNSASSNLVRFGEADKALLVVRPRLADLHALGSWLANPAVNWIAASERLGLVLVGDGPYPDAEIEGALGVPVFGRVPYDPDSADGLLAVPASDRILRRAPLVRAARTLAEQLSGERRHTVGTPADVEHRLESTASTRRGPGVRRQWRSARPAVAANGASSSGVAPNGVAQ